MNLLYIHWNPDPVLFHIGNFGNFGLRWYSIFWMIAILAACQVVYKLYQVKKLPMDTYQSLFVYCMVGVFVGARLGHCLFYDPSYFLAHPLEIVLPVRFLPNGDWIFTGYAGLASHGGTLGLIIALYLFCRKTKIHYGMPTTLPWAFVFEQVDLQPRHPAQLYEALAYFLFFGIMVWIYRKRKDTVRKGFYFGLCIALIFTFRFFIEFLKERQVDFENAMPIDMGQVLSIPFILLGLYFVFRHKTDKLKKLNT